MPDGAELRYLLAILAIDSRLLKSGPPRRSIVTVPVQLVLGSQSIR